MSPTNSPRPCRAHKCPAPYTPRPLSRAEKKKKDVYAFLSPKLGREVWILSALGFAVALALEFDPQVISYCERPRYFYMDKHRIEISYWTHHANAEEHLWLVVPTEASEAATGGRRRFRHEKQMQEVAQKLQVSIRFWHEQDIVKQGIAVGTWLALLPYVQTAQVLENRAAVEAAVSEYFRFAKATSFDQIEKNLSAYHSHDVRAVVCAGIHDGWLSIDLSHPLHVHTVIRRGDNHEQA